MADYFTIRVLYIQRQISQELGEGGFTMVLIHSHAHDMGKSPKILRCKLRASSRLRIITVHSLLFGFIAISWNTIAIQYAKQ
jgi:hypothetical protein